jgi:hypothetical protein
MRDRPQLSGDDLLKLWLGEQILVTLASPRGVQLLKAIFRELLAETHNSGENAELNSKQAAFILGISPEALIKRAHRQTVRSDKRGPRYYFYLREIERLKEARRLRPHQTAQTSG